MLAKQNLTEACHYTHVVMLEQAKHSRHLLYDTNEASYRRTTTGNAVRLSPPRLVLKLLPTTTTTTAVE